jgi:hypothetical protein
MPAPADNAGKKLISKSFEYLLSAYAEDHGLCLWMNADSVTESLLCPWVNATADSATGG